MLANVPLVRGRLAYNPGPLGLRPAASYMPPTATLSSSHFAITTIIWS